MSLYARYSALLDGILDELVAEGRLNDDANRKAVAVEPPRDPSHGDLATNAAMVLAKGAGTNPRALAAALLPKLEAIPAVMSAEVAGPGFINLRLDQDAWRDELTTIRPLAAARTDPYNVISTDGRAEPIRGAEMTASGFEALGVAPIAGRVLLPAFVDFWTRTAQRR